MIPKERSALVHMGKEGLNITGCCGCSQSSGVSDMDYYALWWKTGCRVCYGTGVEPIPIVELFNANAVLRVL